MKKIISCILIAAMFLAILPETNVWAEENICEVFLSGLPADSEVTGLSIGVGSSVESYAYSEETLLTDENGVLVLSIPAGYAQIEVMAGGETCRYVGTAAESEVNEWIPVTETLSLNDSDVTVSSDTAVIWEGSTIFAQSEKEGLQYSWQHRQIEEDGVWEEVAKGDSYQLSDSDVGCMIRLVITKEGAYGKYRKSVVEEVKSFLTADAKQSYIFNNEEQEFAYTLLDSNVQNLKIEYKKTTDKEYSQVRPRTVGTYDVKVIREANISYGYYEKEFSNVIRIDKNNSFKITEFFCGDSVYTGNPVTLIYALPTTISDVPVKFYYKKKDAPDTDYTENAPVEVGAYTVKAVVEETENYNGDTMAADFNITGVPQKPEDKVEFAPVYTMSGSQGNLNLKVGDKRKIGLTSDGTIQFSSSDSKVVTVDGSGALTAKKAGEAVITVTVKEDTTLHTQFIVKVSLNTPKKLKKGKVTGKYVKLTWSRSNGASSYTVYRATKKNGKYKALKKVKGCKYTDKKVKRKKTYYYKVCANAGKSVYSSSKTAALKVKTKK